MAKMRSWFDLLKRFFISDKQSTDEKKDNRKECVFFRRFKVKSKVPPITAPSVSPERGGGRLIQSEEEQSKHALNVAQAASEAAAVATDVVWHTGGLHFTHQCRKKTEEHSAVSIQADDPHCSHHSKKETQEFAAIRIQTAFRGYLAREAFRALRGIVKLQAIIRGRNVRRQAIHTLKCLQSIVNIQSQVCAKRTQKVEGVCGCDENKLLQTLGDKILKMDTNSPKRWDGSILTKKEAEALFLSKKEAAIKRERIKEYSFGHRNSAETDRCKLNGRWRYWLEQWVDTQLSKSKELEDLDSVVTLNPKPKVVYRRKQYKHRGAQRHYQNEGLYSPAAAATAPAGRTLHRKQCSLGDDKSFSGSPLFPTYMAATESARAKARSLSSPRLRPGASDAHSESYSPCKFKPCLVSSTPTELPTSGRFGRGSWYQQRSPSLKGLQGLMRSTQTMKDLSFDSECSLRTWDHQSSFR